MEVLIWTYTGRQRHTHTLKLHRDNYVQLITKQILVLLNKGGHLTKILTENDYRNHDMICTALWCLNTAYTFL